MTIPAAIPRDQLEAIRQAVLDGETLLDYPALAKRLGVEESTVRGYVAGRMIRPCINRGNVVRFHWPSVVAELLGVNRKGKRS